MDPLFTIKDVRVPSLGRGVFARKQEGKCCWCHAASGFFNCRVHFSEIVLADRHSDLPTYGESCLFELSFPRRRGNVVAWGSGARLSAKPMKSGWVSVVFMLAMLVRLGHASKYGNLLFWIAIEMMPQFTRHRSFEPTLHASSLDIVHSYVIHVPACTC